MRVFLDTNVLVSAFAARGLCADLFELILLEHELIVGAATLDELRGALTRKIRLSTSACDEIVGFVRDRATAFVNTAEPASAAVDAADARVLGEALEGAAEVFVTGDAAIQRLAQIGPLRIVSPRGFWEARRAAT